MRKNRETVDMFHRQGGDVDMSNQAADGPFEVLARTLCEDLGDERVNAAIKEARRRDLALLDAFVDSVSAEDIRACRAALCALQGREIWSVVAFAAAECRPSDAFRQQFLDVWVESGDVLRDEFCDDNALLALLWAMLPRYVGPPRTLYRSEFAFNVVTREFGVSWTSSIDTARRFSTGSRCTFPGGLAIVETRAPSDAIIARVPRKSDRLQKHQHEFIVDRRKLGQVKVVKRVAAIWPGDCRDIPEDVRQRWREAPPHVRARWEAAAADLPCGFIV